MDATENVRQCPKCRLINPQSAGRCDCGYVFTQPPIPENLGRTYSPRITEHVLVCPKCGLLSHPSAERCDCGHNFTYRSSQTRRPGSARAAAAFRRDSSGAVGPAVIDDYDLLGASRGASLEEIKAAWRRQMALYHPDKVATLGAELRVLAERKTKELNAAYERLCGTADWKRR